jgi:serine/threonine-protein kinase RsbT
VSYGLHSAPLNRGDGSAAILAVLEQTFSASDARTLLMVARQRADAVRCELAGSRLTTVLQMLESSLGAYLADSVRRRSCISALQRVGAEYGGLLASESVPWIVPIKSDQDVGVVTDAARSCARYAAMTSVNQTKLMTATAEIARNIVQYARSGEIRFTVFERPRAGVLIVASDMGPGIADITKVMSPKYVSKTGMGIGLQGARRLVDEFAVESSPTSGTKITMRKYV